MQQRRKAPAEELADAAVRLQQRAARSTQHAAFGSMHVPIKKGYSLIMPVGRVLQAELERRDLLLRACVYTCVQTLRADMLLFAEAWIRTFAPIRGRQVFLIKRDASASHTHTGHRDARAPEQECCRLCTV